MNSPLRRVAPAILLALVGLSKIGFAEGIPPAAYAHVLQADSLTKTQTAAVQKLAAGGRDWIVLDAIFSSPGDTKNILENLAPLFAAHKPTLAIESAKRPERQTFARESAAQHGLVCLVTDRPLKTLGASGK